MLCKHAAMSFDHTDQRWVDEAVHLVAYDPGWTQKFDTVAAALAPMLRPWLTGGLHHVGSTAIPGLAAKPVIDVLAGVASLDDSRPCIDVLRDVGWWYAPYRTEDMHWFCAPSPAHREFHLHVAETGGSWLMRELAFRDYLRANPPTAKKYEALKVTLAKRYPNDREAYTDGKAGFIESVLRAAGV